MKKIILSFLVFISLQASSQTVYVVTKNTDPIPFVDYYNFIDSLCDPDMYGTFQWALRKANDTPGACEIRFNIPGSGPHIILLSGYLPGTTKTIYINGASQPGYQPGNPQIIFDGQETVFCFLNFYSTKNVTIEGIYIRNLTTCGIWCYIPDSLTIKNCVINQITNNTSTFGIYFHTPSYCTLQGNYIGTDNQNASLPIKSYGIAMWFYANHNLIGGTENGQANIISNCGTSGIYIGIESSYNHISGNIITNNPKAILLGQGANQSKQAPVITSATADTVSGTSAPGDIIEIFGSTGNENMNEYLGTTITDANSDWTINNVQTSFNYVVATATDIEGNTSIVSLVKSTTIQACKDEVLHYHISGVNTNSPVHITITYPNDINGLDSASIQEYPATSIQIDTTNPSIPQYTFNAPDTSFTFNYHIIAGCKNFSPTTQNIHYSINQDGIISTDSFNLSSPWIVFDPNPIASQNIIYNNAHLGTAFERTFYYKNTSLSGVFSGVIEFRDSIRTAIHIDSVWVVAPASGTIDVLYSEITDSTVIYKVKVDNIGFLDSIEFKELVFLNDCPNGYNNLTFFNAKYGCDSSNLCVPINSTYPYTQTFFDPNDKPIISYTILTPGYQSCWSDSLERVMMVVNNGGGSAESVYIGITSGDTPFGWYQNNITDHPINDFEVFRKVNGIEIPIPFVPTPVIFWYNDNAIKTIDSLNPHDTIYFRYYEKINCIDSSNYNNYFNEITYMHWEGFPSVQLNHPCYPSTMPYPFIPSGNGYYNASWRKSFKLNQTFNNLIGTMPDGDTAWFDVLSNSLDLGHNDSWNCYGFIFDMDNSELIVELDLEPGLGLVDSNLYLSSIHNNITTNLYANSIEFTPDPNGFADGNKIKAKFSFPDSMYFEYTDHYSGIVDLPKPSFNNFFSDFKVNFQLYADCHFAADTPTTITQKVFFNPNKTCANQCLIPLSKVEDNIFILCPGCLLPGWNISEFEIKRTNFGGADTNNNNYPDSYPVQPVDTNIAQNQHIIVGDTINCHIIAHTSDGESLLFNNIGFPFTNGQLLCKGGILNNLKFIGGNGTFNDADNGTFNFVIPSLADTIVLESAFALDIGISALENYGVPNSVVSFNLGDLFDFNLKFVVTDNLIFPGGLNPLYNIKEMDAFVNMSGTPYTGIDVKSDASNYQQDTLLAMTPGDRAILNYWCTGYEGRVVAIGTDFHSEMESMNYGVGHDGDINNFNPCYNTIGITSTTDLGRTLSTYNWEWQTPSTPMEWNTFSFELRNLWMLDSLTFSFPNVYKIDRIDIKTTQLTDIDTSSNNVVTGFNCTMFNYHRTLINVNDLYNYDISSSTDAIITDSSVTIYPYNHYSQITGFQGCDNILTAYDETKRYRIELRLKMKDYQLTPNTIAGSEYVRAFWSSFPGASSGDTTIINNYNMTFTKPVANLQTQTLLHEQDYLNTDLVWNMIINTDTNLTTYPGLIYNRAENSFIYFLSPHNNIFVDSVLWTNNQTHVPVVNTINSNPLYGLGRIGADWTTIDSAHISIYASYDCSNVGTTDTLIAIYGWNCYGYPDTLENACYLDTTYLIINLLQTGYQVDLSTNNTISVCDTATYDITVTATGTGSVDNIQIDMAESLNNEYSYVPGSAYIQYNGSTEFLEPLNIHLDSLTWLLNSVSILNNFETDTLHLIFNVAGGCGFGNHDVEFTVNAENYCSKPLGTIHVSGIPLITSFLIQDSLLVNIIADTISVCGSDSALVQVTITNTGSNPTSALNTLDVILPNSFSWSSGDTYTSSTGQTYTFNLNGDIIPLSSQTIQFYISGNSGNGIFDVIANAYVTQSLPCNNDTCVFTQTVAESTDTSTITVHEITIASIVSTDVSAFGASDGSADLTVSGGNPPYTFLWSNGATTEDISGLTTDTYSVTITDASGCTHVESVLINEPPGISLSIYSTYETCSGECDGTATVSVTGGTPPYNYIWDDPSFQSTSTAINLCPGLYNLTVSDNLGISEIETVNIITDPVVFYNQPPNLIISSGTTEVWSGGGFNYTVSGFIEVNQDAQLKLQNCTLQFGANSGIIVHERGNLIIDDAVLKKLDACYSLWDGIIILGDKNLNQTVDPYDIANPQGFVHIMNGSVVENAKFAFDIGGGGGNNPNIATAGGVLWVESNSILRNNHYCAVFQYYDKPNYSHFTDCQVIVDNSVLTNGMIICYYTDGLIFNNVVFDAVPLYPANYMTAIAGWGWLYNCNISYCTFNNMQRGIRNYYLYNGLISHNTFNNVQRGVEILSGSFNEIYDNNFNNIPFGYYVANVNYDAWGIYMVAPSAYNIYNNNFNGFSSTDPTQFASYGTVIKGIYSGSGILFNNTYGSTDFGIQSQGVNSGMKVRCNKFYAPAVNSLAVLKDYSGHGELMNQGVSCNNDGDPAGNKWLDPATTPDMNIYVQDDITFDYYSYKSDEFNVVNTIPFNSSDDIPFQWFSNYAYPNICFALPMSTNSCIDPLQGITYDPNNNLNQFISQVNAQILANNNLINSQNNLIDGGQKQQLLNLIQNNAPNGTLKNKLLLASPYLSDEVLLAALLEKSTPLSSGHVKEIIIANSPVTAEIMTAVNSLGLPAGILKLIQNAQHGVSTRQHLEMQTNALNGENQLIENELVNYYLKTSDVESAKQFLAASSNLESQKKLSDILYVNKDYADCRSVVNNLAVYQNAKNQIEIQNYSLLLNCLLDLAGQGKTIYELTSVQEQIIRNVASTNTQAAINAQVILYSVYGDEFEHPILKKPLQLRNQKIQNEQSVIPDVMLYPNPTTGNITIESSLSLVGNILTFQLTDILGQVVLKTTFTSNGKNEISLHELSIGLYQYRILDDDGGILTEDKLVISK